MAYSDQEIRQAITTEITSAFEDVQRGDGITLHQAQVLDYYGDEKEEAEARAKDTDTRWQDIPDSLIEELSGTLRFLDAKGFCYYIPAFMIWALRHHETSDSFARDAAVYAFGVDPLAEHHMERFRVLAEQQTKAVAHFLWYFAYRANKDYADDVVAQEALDAYWARFL